MGNESKEQQSNLKIFKNSAHLLMLQDLVGQISEKDQLTSLKKRHTNFCQLLSTKFRDITVNDTENK